MLETPKAPWMPLPMRELGAKLLWRSQWWELFLEFLFYWRGDSYQKSLPNSY